MSPGDINRLSQIYREEMKVVCLNPEITRSRTIVIKCNASGSENSPRFWRVNQPLGRANYQVPVPPYSIPCETL